MDSGNADKHANSIKYEIGFVRVIKRHVYILWTFPIKDLKLPDTNTIDIII